MIRREQPPDEPPVGNVSHTVGVRIDLHTHSTESDGTDTPAELVATALAAGLDAIAITDHDTTAGWAEAERAVRELAAPGTFRLVPGAELSCSCPTGRGGTTTVHLLAYLFDPKSPALQQEQARLRAERRSRLHQMARRMADDGFPVDPDELMAGLPPDSPGGRPHLARALVAAGTVASVDEAFARYLGTGGQYYLPRTDTPVHRAIEMITEAGGVTVLAHLEGRVLHDRSYPNIETKELMIDNAFKIDGIEGGYVREVKVSSKMTEADRMQTLYYLYQLHQRGIEKKGLISYTKEKKTEEIVLNEENNKRLEDALQKIQTLLSQSKPPPFRRLPYCTKCAYQFFCFAREEDNG